MDVLKKFFVLTSWLGGSYRSLYNRVYLLVMLFGDIHDTGDICLSYQDNFLDIFKNITTSNAEWDKDFSVLYTKLNPSDNEYFELQDIISSHNYDSLVESYCGIKEELRKYDEIFKELVSILNFAVVDGTPTVMSTDPDLVSIKGHCIFETAYEITSVSINNITKLVQVLQEINTQLDLYGCNEFTGMACFNPEKRELGFVKELQEEWNPCSEIINVTAEYVTFINNTTQHSKEFVLFQENGNSWSWMSISDGIIITDETNPMVDVSNADEVTGYFAESYRGFGDYYIINTFNNALGVDNVKPENVYHADICTYAKNELDGMIFIGAIHPWQITSQYAKESAAVISIPEMDEFDCNEITYHFPYNDKEDSENE